MGATGYTGGDPRKVDRAGDTMTGPLILSETPDGADPPLQAATNEQAAAGGGGGGGTPSGTVVAETAFALGDNPGSATTYSRGDHTHGTPPTPTAGSVGADPAGSATSAVTAHNADTTGVHGITDTSVLETTTGAQAKADAAQAAAVASSAQRAANLGDLGNAGTARTNLGLGGAAVLNVGATVGTVAAGDDARLSNARIPTAHASTHAAAGSDPVTPAAIGVPPTTRTIATTPPLSGGGDLTANRTLSVSVGATTGTVAAGDDARIVGAAQKSANLSDLGNSGTARTSLGLGNVATRNVGTTTGTAAAGDDGRFADARTPTAHASTHAPAGTDPLTGLTATNFAGTSIDGTAGTASLRTLGTGAQQAAAGNHTHGGGGSGTTSGYLWDGDSYELVNPHKIAVGPVLPSAPSNGDVWFNTVAGSTVLAGFSAATSLPADITSGGVAHTPGAWVEFFASTAVLYGRIIVNVSAATSASGNTRSILMDIGVGASGSETVIVDGLDVGRCGYGQVYEIPLVIPAGSRVVARIQARETSLTIRAQVALTQTPPYAVYYNSAWQYAGSGSAAVTYGITDASSVPVALTTAGAINTWAAWTVLAASTVTALRYLLVLPSGPVGANWGAVNVNALVDVAAGPDGSEVSVLGGALAYRWTTAEACERSPLLIAVTIPAGSRLVGRYQADSTAVAPALSVIGFS